MKRVLLFAELADRGVRLSRRQIDRVETAGKFPKRIPMGDRRVGWLAEEIDAYVDQAIASRSMGAGKLGSFDRRRLAETETETAS
jgi:predicted DNA-binding transcriptional regulator AlpA